MAFLLEGFSGPSTAWLSEVVGEFGKMVPNCLVSLRGVKKFSVKGIDFEFVMLVICFILKIKTETWFQRFRRGIMPKTSVCVICII